jgi:hypothetical protein
MCYVLCAMCCWLLKLLGTWAYWRLVYCVLAGCPSSFANHRAAKVQSPCSAGCFSWVLANTAVPVPVPPCLHPRRGGWLLKPTPCPLLVFGRESKPDQGVQLLSSQQTSATATRRPMPCVTALPLPRCALGSAPIIGQPSSTQAPSGLASLGATRRTQPDSPLSSYRLPRLDPLQLTDTLDDGTLCRDLIELDPKPSFNCEVRLADAAAAAGVARTLLS